MSEQDIAAILDLGKKKKKKKKKVAVDGEGEADTAEQAEEERIAIPDEVSAMFAGKKKKKKKKDKGKEETEEKVQDKKPEDGFATYYGASSVTVGSKTKNEEGGFGDDEEESASAPAENDIPDDGEDADADEISHVRFAEEIETDQPDDLAAAEPARAWLGSDRDYHFKELLDRFYYLMHGNSGNMGNTRLTIRPPEVYREGTKKTVFVNFGEICRALKRDKEHMLSFMLAELGTTGSIDASDRLTMRGRLLPKQIQTLLRRYITEYVTCHMCKSPDTSLEKNQAMRLHFVTCNVCQSSRSVTPIKAGYKAQVGRRKRK